MARFILDIKDLHVDSKNVQEVVTNIEDLLAEYFDNAIRLKCVDFTNRNQFIAKKDVVIGVTTNELTKRQVTNFKYICNND